jgi:iturin family lipopeptide synthetase A
MLSIANPGVADVPAVAVIGMAGRFPQSRDLNEFWQRLKDGLESIRHYTDEELLAAGVAPETLDDSRYVKASAPLDGIEYFDAEFFGITPRDAALMDPQQRLLLETAWEAIEHAGYAAGKHKSIGVYAGASSNTYFIEKVLSNPALLRDAGIMQVSVSNEKDFLCTRIAHQLDLHGPAITVQTACSTSLVAVHLACQAILSGECDMALAGGVSANILGVQGYFHTPGGISSPNGQCRAFDADAAGTVAANGIGIVVLKALDAALQDRDTIYAVIRGSAINNDGSSKMGFTAPSADMQAAVIAEAQAVAGVEPDEISYVETHGTGTSLGDPVEIAALQKAFSRGTNKKNFCAIGSLKTNIGHTDAASGVAGLIKTVLALRHRQIPASLHFTRENPHIGFADTAFRVQAQCADWPVCDRPLIAAVSSFGIGGTNAHVIVGEAPASHITRSSRPWYVLPVSAKTEEALGASVHNLIQHLAVNPDISLPDVAYTLQAGRAQFSHRAVLLVDQDRQAVRLEESSTVSEPVADAPPHVVFLFPGQGTQYPGMTADLYQNEPLFRMEVDRCAELLKTWLKVDIRQHLYPAQGEEEAAGAALQDTRLTQPVLFTVEYALAKLCIGYGVVPAAMVGHSIGEYVAACLAKVMSLPDALYLVAQRGILMSGLPSGGGMLAVRVAEPVLNAMLCSDVWLAAVNAPDLCTVAGAFPALDRLAASLIEQGIECHQLRTSHAFHSELMRPILAEFSECIRKVTLHPPQVPYLSNVSGTWITAQQSCSPQYWLDHLMRPVRFGDNINAAQDKLTPVFLEVGPGRTLSALATSACSSARTVQTVTDPKAAANPLYFGTALARLWLYRVPIDWEESSRSEQRGRIPLPTYPFARVRHWIDAPSAPGGIAKVSASVSAPMPHAHRKIRDWFNVPVWRNRHPHVARKVHEPGAHLVFCDNAAIVATLVDSLRLCSEKLIVVTPGIAFRQTGPAQYEILPQDPASYQRLVATLAAGGTMPVKISHFWGIDTANTLSDMAHYRGFYSLMFLSQALAQVETLTPIAITVVTNGVHQVLGDEWISAEKACVLGACKVVPLEIPELKCRHIDIVLDTSGKMSETTQNMLLGELLNPGSCDSIALRGRSRWVQTFEPMPDGCGAPVMKREHGHYLITGGLGGVGYEFALYLKRHDPSVTLTLVGRGILPPVTAWDTHLAASDGKDRIAESIRMIRALGSEGGAINYISADLGREDEVRELQRAAIAASGPVHGIFHAAGLPGNSVMQTSSVESVEEVWAAKVRGTRFLGQAFDVMTLDFFMLCSSASSVMPLGQADYCAANLFLDAYARERASTGGGHVIVINWGPWEHVGMASKISSAAMSSRARGSPAHAISPAVAPYLFNVLFEHGPNQVVVLPADFNDTFASFEKFRASLAERTKPVSHAGMHVRNLPAPFDAPSTELESGVAAIWEGMFGIKQVGIRDNFFDLGGHSLLATQIVSKICSQYRVQLSLEAFFASPTIAGVSEIVEAMILQEIEQLSDVEALVQSTILGQ